VAIGAELQETSAMLCFSRDASYEAVRTTPVHKVLNSKGCEAQLPT